jgi:hypothetical protein
MKYIVLGKSDPIAEWIFTRIYWWCRLCSSWFEDEDFRSDKINSDVISDRKLYFAGCSENQAGVTKRMVLSRVDRHPIGGNLGARKRKAGRIGLAIEGT